MGATNKEWIKCSSVAVGFYMIVYILLAYVWFGFFNPWLIISITVLTVIDIKAIKWLIEEFGEKEEDPYP